MRGETLARRPAQKKRALTLNQASLVQYVVRAQLQDVPFEHLDLPARPIPHLRTIRSRCMTALLNSGPDFEPGLNCAEREAARTRKEIDCSAGFRGKKIVGGPVTGMAVGAPWRRLVHLLIVSSIEAHALDPSKPKPIRP